MARIKGFSFITLGWGEERALVGQMRSHHENRYVNWSIASQSLWRFLHLRLRASINPSYINCELDSCPNLGGEWLNEKKLIKYHAFLVELSLGHSAGRI
jgi:hypothetical protein